MERTDELSRVVYTPEAELRSPGRLLVAMWRDLLASRELAWRLFVRDVSARYRQSLLGIFWAFLPPIVMGTVFIILQSHRVVNFGETEIPYPVYVLVGTTLWQLFTESLNAPINVVRNARPLLAKVNFPREALILSAFYDMLLNSLIKATVIAVILVAFEVAPAWGILLAPAAVVMLILLGLTIGLLLTPLGMLYTDVTSGLTVVIQLWFFATPVVYPPPRSFPYSLLATANPVAPPLTAARDLIAKGSLANGELFLLVSGLTIAGFVIAWVMFRVAAPIIIERMSA